MGFEYTYNYRAALCTAASSWDFYQARFWNAWGVTFLTPQMADLFRLFHRCWIFGFDPWQCRFKTMDKNISYHVYIYIHNNTYIAYIWWKLTFLVFLGYYRLYIYTYTHIDICSHTHTHQGLPFFILNWLFHCEVNHLLYLCSFCFFWTDRR